MKYVIRICKSLAVVLVACTISSAQSYAQSSEQAKSQAEVLFQKGLDYYNAGDYDKAVETYTQVITLDATHVNAYWNRGLLYDSQEKYELALADFRRATELAPDFSDAHGMVGWYLIEQRQFAEARDACQKAYQLSPDNFAWAINLGHTYLLTGDATMARRYYKEALPLITTEEEFLTGPVADFELFIEKGWHVEASRRELAWMKQQFEAIYHFYVEANAYWSQSKDLEEHGQYLEAAQLAEKSAEVEQSSPKPRLSALASELNQAGYCYYLMGQYDKSLNYYEQALELAQKLGRSADVAVYLNDIGMVYQMWGKYDKALVSLEKALELERKLERLDALAIRFSNIGTVYYDLKHYDQAIKYYEQALELERKLNMDKDIAIELSNIGSVYRAWGQYGKALEYYEQALDFARNSEDIAAVATRLNNIGAVYHDLGLYDQAMQYYEQALGLDRKLHRDAEIANDLSNIGLMYYDQKNYPQAITYLEESVNLKEQLRKTATGDIRRDYLASQIHTYQFLISCYLRTENFTKAFEIIELSRAKLLTEQLAGTDEVSIPSLDRIQSELPEDTGVLIYANTDWQSIVQVVITKEKITASEHSLSEPGQNVMNQEQSDATRISSETRGLNMGQKKPQKTVTTDMQKPFDLTTIIKDYRAQLLNPSPGRGLSLGVQEKSVQDNELKDTSKRDLDTSLYSLLFGNVQQQLQEKTRLIIVPDGILNFLPFETLTDDQGRYLAETYTISYAQSLAVLDLIGQRQYTSDRKPLLAFGGAVYDTPTYEAQMIENETQLAYLQKQIDDALSKGEPVGKLYAQLRGSGWDNLPGTLQEVKAIQQVVPGAEIVTGADVNEAVVKNLSAKDELANYKVLHFATHGDADARIPELSALVLSLGEQASPPASEKDASETLAVQEEDGFLRAGEIVDLTLKADFVSLSACETGLGKLYSGEGMVGLTQAFLLTGANGLSVSLWSVADESTATFMVALYKLVEEQGLSYAEAISEVKRRFIAGDFGENWKAPFYWAPFVYYGK